MNALISSREFQVRVVVSQFFVCDEWRACAYAASTVTGRKRDEKEKKGGSRHQASKLSCFS